MNIEFTNNLKSSEIEFLTQKINDETQEYGKAYQFAFFIKGIDNEIIAGCNGSVIFGVIYTDQLWVKNELRGQGIGKQLMGKIHEYGKEIGCQISTVATMSFQAKEFYESLGYVVEFERHGYTNESFMIFLKRNISS